ncbi:uncharacterized protein LOC109196412 isoform X1 [Oreochromis niloticus]|uniref:uncharacterized protein LOC109196412 isoform X1 n=1 Tax=Oreochromis niloticus TaxID=8128 RepID=UPI0009051181|nr:uncharacterized protein LOC109196412 isoform X1 [Oreochromis niloticus]
MNNQKGKPEFMYILPQSKLDKLIQARKAFQNTMSETLKQLNAEILMLSTKQDQIKIRAGELTDQSASYKVEMSSATKEKGDQTCSDQEKTINFDLEMNRLKEQLQQRDSEILILKQEKDSLSAELTQLQKHEGNLKETMWNALWKEQTQRANLEREKKVLEEENKKLLEEQKVVNDTKVKLKEAMSNFEDANKAFKKEQKELEEAMSKDSKKDKESQTETQLPEMQTQLDEQRKELVDATTETEETVTPELSSSENLEVHQSAEKSDLKTPPTDDSENRETSTQDHQEASGTTQKKIFTADKQDFDKIEPCPLEMPVKPADSGSDLSPSDISLVIGDHFLIREKLCAKKFVHLVVSQATEKVSSKHKFFTKYLTPDSISDHLIEKIWPEIEKKHLDLSPKRLKNLDKAILKDLCKAHSCKDKYLIFNLREQYDDITVPTFTKKLLSLPRRVLSVSKNREEYKEVVKNVTKDVVMRAMAGINEAATWHPDTAEFIIQRLSHIIWNKILSKNYKMSLENIEQLALTVYNELNKKWPSPIFSMRLSSPVTDEIIVKTFKKHAKLKRQNFIYRAFSCACACFN